MFYSPAGDFVRRHFGQSLSIVPLDSVNIIVCLYVKYIHLQGSIAYSHRYRHAKSRPEGLLNTADHEQDWQPCRLITALPLWRAPRTTMVDPKVSPKIGILELVS